MDTHTLKVVPPYFDGLLDGTKTFEIRRNDRAFQRGDELILWEWDPAYGPAAEYGRGINKRAVSATVGFVYSGDPRWPDLERGYVVLSLLDVREVVPT